MRMPTFALRTSTVLAALVTGVLLVPSAAALADVVPPAQPFYADSGDDCLYGYTKGEMTIDPLPPTVASLSVSAIVVDRPLPADPGKPCVDDYRYTAALFTAYSDGTTVDSEMLQVDNGQLEATFTLGDVSWKDTPIDLVAVQVCRVSPGIIMDEASIIPLLYDYCGQPQEYKFAYAV